MIGIMKIMFLTRVCMYVQEQVRKCGCEYHLKMEELVAGLHKWRQTQHKRMSALVPEKHCTACVDRDAYLAVTKNLSSFGEDACPCERGSDGLRKLECATGACVTCRNLRCAWSKCTCIDDEAELPVKYKWLRPIQIGGRADTEWAWMELPYAEFENLLVSYFEDTYRLHNWVYKRQDLTRRNCRRTLQPQCAILEVDYAAKMSQFSQDAMPCSATKQTSNFVAFAHFAPKLQDGKNLTDTTEVFTFHSDCVKQDTHSIRRCLEHIIENLQQRGFLSKTVHIWADGCGAQNKGRKAFRQLSELSMQLGINVIANFPASHHFPGPWDTEGGRHNRAITRHIQNDRGVASCEAILSARDNVHLLRRILNKAGQPDPPVPTQEKWRPPTTPMPTPASLSLSKRQKPVVHQPRGRSEEEMAEVNDQDDGWYEIQRRHIWRIEPCSCSSECACPRDERLTYKRDEKYDCTHIVGTMSTYCYGFFRKALHVQLRQYSCYCRWCAMEVWDRCTSLPIVRHAPGKPIRPLDAGYVKWRDEGWRCVKLAIRSVPDRAVTRVAIQSVEAAREYVSKLSMGGLVAFFTTEGGRGYWLGSKQSEIVQAKTTDETTGIKKGEEVFKIVWYENMSGLKYRKLDYETVASVSSVLVTVSNLTWNRCTVNRYYMGETTHRMLIDIVETISEL